MLQPVLKAALVLVVFIFLSPKHNSVSMLKEKSLTAVLSTKGIDIKTKVNVRILETAAGVLNTRTAATGRTVTTC